MSGSIMEMPLRSRRVPRQHGMGAAPAPAGRLVNLNRRADVPRRADRRKHQRPDSEVRKTLRHALMRTSKSKGHWQAYDSNAPLNPKFAIGLAAILCELGVRTRRGSTSDDR